MTPNPLAPIDNENPQPDGSENPEPESPEDDKVQTVTTNLGANDGLSIDGNGILYASNFNEFMGTQVVKIDPGSETIEEAVGNLRAPTGNVVDSLGNIFVVHNVRRVEPESDDLIGDVIKIDGEGNRTTLATLPGFPSGITLDQEGNLYVSNFAFPGVHKVDMNGEITVYAQDTRLTGGVGIDFGDDGNLFVGNFGTGAILRIDTARSVDVLTTLPTVQQGVVIGYLTVFEGSIYATAAGENVIYKVTFTGEASIFAGSGASSTMDGSLLEASFNTPNGIVGDANNNVLYVTEVGGALRLIDLN